MSTLGRLVHQYGYWTIAAGVGGESLGLPLPGETTLILAAAYAAKTHHLSPGVVVLVAAAAAIAGDNAGFWLGRRFGLRLLGGLTRRLGRRAEYVTAAQQLFDRHGSWVVAIGRFVSVIRTYTGVIAGTSQMRWRRFSALNALSSVAWAALFGFGVAALGSSAGSTIALASIAVLVAAGVASAVVLRRIRHRSSLLQRPSSTDAKPSGPEGRRATTHAR